MPFDAHDAMPRVSRRRLGASEDDDEEDLSLDEEPS
jgi:hypothetical protein